MKENVSVKYLKSINELEGIAKEQLWKSYFTPLIFTQEHGLIAITAIITTLKS